MVFCRKLFHTESCAFNTCTSTRCITREATATAGKRLLENFSMELDPAPVVDLDAIHEDLHLVGVRVDKALAQNVMKGLNDHRLKRDKVKATVLDINQDKRII